MMIQSLDKIQHVFFIGIAGTGMSALAQYLNGIGKNVSGSDRYFSKGEAEDIKIKLEADGITCFPQDGSGIHEGIELVIVSTAVEDTVPEVQQAKTFAIPIIKRSELLSLICKTKRTIAVGGTSGKSTTSAMIFAILEEAGMGASIISGAGLTCLIKEGRIGNAKVGKGEWLVIEADESDGSIVQYEAEIGLLLNIDKDHKEIDVLLDIFQTFKNKSRYFSVNRSHPLAARLSKESAWDFTIDENMEAGYKASAFDQRGLDIRFEINKQPFLLHSVGKHNMENVLAAVAITSKVGVELSVAARAIASYEGIYRRHQVWGTKGSVTLIDDYAHNPVKCAASIRACQPAAKKLIAWFQPHGYAPTKFLRQDFGEEISTAIREGDEVWMSEIFYAGGTTTKDISAADLIGDLKAKGVNAFFVEDRNQLVETMRPHFSEGTVLLLMGARDPSLEKFAAQVWSEL
ncbi:MAG: UDP-N-acetylmuramate--L-alanine ligase [Sphingobacteriales bacterium]|jgi:UDP-N-acetylmuramate--alanine ligase